MLSIVLIIVIWTCNLMPLWANIVCTVLLVIRCIFRALMTWLKLTGETQANIYGYEEEPYYIKGNGE